MKSSPTRIKLKQKSAMNSFFDLFRQANRQKSGQENPFAGSNCQKDLHASTSQFETKALLASLVASFLFASSCTYKSPAVETPIPSEEGIEKSFFVETKTDAKTGKIVNVPKTFLCGWASEMETGWTAEYSYTNNAIAADHCNIVFEITENQLIGKVINPSFPDDPKRWEVAVTIPINSHYYLENDKDSNGKETKKVIKNTGRSHWSARPFVDLNLAGIYFEHQWSSRYWGRWDNKGNMNIEQVEWDKKNGFLGFTVNQGTGLSHYSRIRFNIKEFKHNPDFKKTPFNDQNYKHMNVLHIIGEKVNGVYPILHAAHWDLSKTHEIRLWQVPEEYKELVKEIVNDWNESFRKIGAVEAGHSPFVVSEKDAEHAFDLRHPTIAWVSDEKISNYSPLGIGMALADVKNGEIRWGMITLYGGYIEKYIKAYQPGNSGGSNLLGKLSSQIFDTNTLPRSLQVPKAILDISASSAGRMTQLETEGVSKKMAESLYKHLMTKKNSGAKDAPTGSPEEILKHATVLPEHVQQMFAEGIKQVSSKVSEANQHANNLTPTALLKKSMFPTVKKSQSEDAAASQAAMTSLPKMSKSDFIKKYSDARFCTERTFNDVGPGWAVAATERKAGKLADDKKLIRHVIKELTTHEFGHFLGLGHQFKENILPEKGTVPDSIYESLAKDATEKAGYTNYTSVMGYRSARTEIDETKDIVPGPQDLLVLRFLYKGEYAAFKKGDKDFTYTTLPKDGIIPDVVPGKEEYKTTYFPQCNDVEASYSFDPYCNRFDRGHDAVSIVKNYFIDLKETLIPNMYAFTDAKGGNAEEVEWRLWSRSLTTLGRVRLFYDYMRIHFKDQIDQIRYDEESLLDFSKACQGTEENNNSTLKRLFAMSPELKNLCKANALALEEMQNLVSKSLPDHTKMDIKQRFTPGGMNGGDTERDWSRIFGSWSEMTGLPMKISALYALTTGVPWVSSNTLFESPLFSHPNYKFAYSSLYPMEFTKIIAANVKNNLRFVSLGQGEKNSMGSSIVSMGFFNYISENENNDPALFASEHIRRIRAQHKFDFSAVAIILKGRKKDNDQTRVDGFDGEVYDFSSGKSIPVTSAYILPNGLVMVDAPNMFVYPFTTFTPFNETDGFVYAYKLDYSVDTRDPLAANSVKVDLKDLNDRLIKACVSGTNGVSNGLSNYFSRSVTEFKGFKMTKALALGDRTEFLQSVDAAYNDYYNYPKFAARPSQSTCTEALRGTGLIISAAAVINGFWLPEAMDYIQK